jgi:iron complex outermembrane receptor protein
LSELYFSGETPRGSVHGNPLLASEETTGSQITLSNHNAELQFELSGFYNRVENYIERVRAGDGNLTYRNLRSGKVWGLDGLVSFQGANRIAHRINWQWQHGEADTGEFLDDLPPPKVSYTGTWRTDVWVVAVELGYRFNRDDRGPGEIPLGSALIGGARVQRDMGPHWSASLSMSNGFDQTYRTSADDNAPLVNERAVHLTLRWTP